VLDRQSKAPAIALRDAFVKGCFERGLLTLGAGPSSVRLAPPLVATDGQVDAGLAIIEPTLSFLTTQGGCAKLRST
jgi:4-aminobutyrate aminotransferase